MLVSYAAGACLAAVSFASAASAQIVTVFRPTVSYYAPPVVVAPTAHWVASPVVVTAASPVIAPAPVVAPTPVVTYYRAPTVAYAPVQQVVTRRRPILGGTVSRVRYAYMPVVVP
jgi:hypothetical protein